MKRSTFPKCLSALVAAWGLHEAAQSQVIINDTLTGTSSSYDWRALNGACLTAGNNTGPIPACVGLGYYRNTLVGGASGRLPDAPGQGALRLTNGDTRIGGSNGDDQTGAVVSNFTFPTDEGLQVTFTSVTYGGDGLSRHGADGISFFLMDGSKPPSVGALGGSLGYSCSNVNSRYDGVTGGYLGIGIDEYGNFSNPDDNTDTGPGFRGGRISMRGAGDTAWVSLNTRYPAYYPSTLGSWERSVAVKSTCRTGYAWNYSGATVTDATGASVPHRSRTNEKLPYNYPLISYSDLPPAVSIANQQGTNMPKRGDATPITYSIRITQDGLLDFSYSVNGGSAQQVIANRRITDSNGPLPASFRFGFSAGTGGGNNVHELTCFKAAPISESNSGGATNVQQSGRVEAGTQVYLAYYHPRNWWGQLTAQGIAHDAANNTVSVNPIANWDASCALTGGTCQSTGTSTTAQDSGSRTILSWNGTHGIPFQWSRLTAAQQSALTTGDASATDARLRYLRGDRTGEVSAGGGFRTRTSVFGDVIHSSPTWVGPPSSPYDGAWADALHPSAEARESDYRAFKTRYATRQNLVYVGANDGLLHAFRAGSHNAAGTFVTNSATPNDGKEALAYMPAAVVSTIHSTSPPLDYSGTHYSHNLFTDATPGVGDLYYGGAWHTWLVSGLGGGASPTGPIADSTTTAHGSIFALDITDPGRFNESNASDLVMGEWSSSTLSCINLPGCGRHLGNTYGTPAIRRLHNGQWAVLFGNGLNSATGTAGLFILLVDPSSGAKTFRYIDTGRGGTAKNGIAYVTPADLDGDHVTDYVYAGDVLGNVWRFDLTSSDPASWSATSEPIFSTPSGQPITSKVVVGSVPGIGRSGRPRVIVAFGTGRQSPQTLTAATSHASGAQALYGVWDWDMAGWNSKAGGIAQYESLVAPQQVTSSDLQAQSVTSTVAATGSTFAYRTVSDSRVCWRGSSACGGGNDKIGWTLPLPSSTEQVIYNPVIAYGMFVVNTTIPAVAAALSCGTQPASGYTMAVALGSGSSTTKSFFPDAPATAIVNGAGLGATGSPSIVTIRSTQRPYLVQQTVGGIPVVTRINPSLAGKGGRLNWIELR